jgi:hypothetical protein
MSAPIQRDDGFDDERFYAPPWARGEPPLETPENAVPPSAPPVAPEPEGGRISWPPAAARLSSFPGDHAATQLRRRLSLEPELAPEPPIDWQRRRRISWPVRIVLVLVAAGAASYGIAPRFAGEQAAPRPSDGQAEIQPWTLASVGVTPQPVPPSRPAVPAARLVVETRQAFEDEPLPVGISLRGAAGNQVVVLDGLAEGTRLSTGVRTGATRWRVAAVDLENLLAIPPDGFVGAMDLAVDLRSASDALVDSQVARIEWFAKTGVAPAASEPRPERAERTERGRQAATPQADPEETAALVQRGFDFMKSGDIAAARLALQRAANAGHAEAALTLGASYDPAILEGLGVVGVAPDVAQARAWYQKAQELGSEEASRRIEQLALAEKR